MNEIQTFDFETKKIRTIIKDNAVWFVGRDVASALGYSKPENALSNHVDIEDKTTTLIQGNGSNYKSKSTIINESGLYSLILSSKLPEAKKFKRWVTNMVLPSIRMNGGYVANQESMSELELLANAMVVSERIRNDQQKQIMLLENENKKSFVTLSELFSGNKDHYTTTEIAKCYGMNARDFNLLLKKNKIQKKVKGVWKLCKKYENEPYMKESSKNVYKDKQLIDKLKYNAWTKDGVKFIYTTLHDKHILPLNERED